MSDRILLQDYVDQLFNAENLFTVDQIMTAASYDPMISSRDFVMLCIVSRQIIQDRQYIT